MEKRKWEGKNDGGKFEGEKYMKKTRDLIYARGEGHLINF